jgi:hypothetical protein
MKKILILGTILMLVSLSLVSSVNSISIKKDNNTEETKLYKLDPPTVWHELDPPEPDGENGWYISPVTISFFADDDVGVDKIKYRIESPWMTYFGPITINIDGEHTFEYYAVDLVGHKSEHKVVTVKCDTTRPFIENFTKNIISLNEIKFTLKCYDATTGIDYVEFYVDGEFYSGQIVKKRFPNEIIFNWTGVGEHKVKAIAYDVAGLSTESEELSTSRSRSMGIVLNRFPLLTRLFNFRI